MATPHINAERGDFSDVMLMPGDPLRAKHIAETQLEQAKLVTNTRNMLGFTGFYRGRRVSVMGHGMGIPSCSIRVGSCGAISRSLKLRDIVIGMGASTDSAVNRQRFKGYDFAALADYGLLQNAVNAAKQQKIDVQIGNIFSADLFYSPDPEMFDVMEKYNILAVEMEAAGLYGVAAEFGAKALCICTVSDHIRLHGNLSAEARQTSFNQMVEVALESVLLGDLDNKK